MHTIDAVLKSQRGWILNPSKILSFTKLKMDMSTKIDTLEQKMSTRMLLDWRKPLFRAKFLSSFEPNLNYKYPEYPSSMITLMECSKANLPQQLSEMQVDHRWSTMPTTPMLINVLHTEGWKGATNPISGLHIAGFIPTSSLKFAKLFNTKGIERVSKNNDYFDDLDLA